MARDDGWLRAVPHDSGSLAFWKWKYTAGPHEGYYVMWRADAGDWIEAVCGLAQKVYEVDIGEQRPTLDKYFGRA